MTPGTGSVSLQQCLSPEMNFYTGYTVLVLIAPLFFIYVIHGRNHRIAFLRNSRVTNRLVKEARSVCTRLYYYAERAAAEKLKNNSRRLLKTWLFLVFAITIFGVYAGILFIGTFGSVFFRSMILSRAFHFIDFAGKMANAVKDIAAFFYIPGLEKVFVPFQLMYAFFSNFKIDLAAINLTCKGGAFQRMLACMYVCDSI